MLVLLGVEQTVCFMIFMFIQNAVESPLRYSLHPSLSSLILLCCSPEARKRHTRYCCLCVLLIIIMMSMMTMTHSHYQHNSYLPKYEEDNYDLFLIFTTSLHDSVYFLNVTCTVAQIYESWLCLVIELFRIQNQIWALGIKAGTQSVSFWEGVTNIAGGRIQISLSLHWQNLPCTVIF